MTGFSHWDEAFLFNSYDPVIQKINHRVDLDCIYFSFEKADEAT